jgi:GT2 family glycosyltransferase
MNRNQVTILITCHNRVDRTLACLRSLATQSIGGAQVDVVLVDAGSVDGTAEAVSRNFPEVTILHRGQELFWNGGMRVALAYAYERDPDYYLWLNDDVELDDGAIGRLLACDDQLQESRPAPTIVVGSTRDPTTGGHTYGGVIRTDRLRRMRYQLVPPRDYPQRVETMNGNCVLVPRAVVERIGNLAAAYTHGMGDYDYGHRAERAGCEVWIAPGTIGTCSRNPVGARPASFSGHRHQVVSPTGGLPPDEWRVFVRRWAGSLWPVLAVSPFVRRYVRWALRR